MLHAVKKNILFCIMLLLALSFLTLTPSSKAYAEKPYKTCEPDEVHSIWWKGKMRYDVDTTLVETQENITVEKGQKVIVQNYSSYVKTSKTLVMLSDGTHCRVPTSSFYLYEDACTKGDYSKATKLNFVNSRKISSSTDYMIWVSTDMQSLNVFKGSKRNWKLVKVCKCSTGMFDWQTPLGSRSIVAKMRVCHSEQWGSNLQYFLSFGGSGIHQWPGGGAGENLGKHPCSHACIRLSRKNSKWMYKRIPKGTRLYIF